MGMRIWHQSMTVLDVLPAYRERIQAHAKKIVHADTEVVVHGLAIDTYPSDYPGGGITFNALFSMHSLQWLGSVWSAQAQGFDGFAVCTTIDPLLREMRSMVDIPVVGCAETCYLATHSLGERFGLLLFNERLAPAYRLQMAQYRMEDRCAGILPTGLSFEDVMTGFDSPGKVIDQFRKTAQQLVDAGAHAIIPGEMPLNLLLASEGIQRFQDVPVIDSLGLTLKMTEAQVELRRSTGLAPSRRGWANARPDPQRMADVMRYYGLSKFMHD